MAWPRPVASMQEGGASVAGGGCAEDGGRRGLTARPWGVRLAHALAMEAARGANSRRAPPAAVTTASPTQHWPAGMTPWPCRGRAEGGGKQPSHHGRPMGAARSHRGRACEAISNACGAVFNAPQGLSVSMKAVGNVMCNGCETAAQFPWAVRPARSGVAPVLLRTVVVRGMRRRVASEAEAELGARPAAAHVPADKDLLQAP